MSAQVTSQHDILTFWRGKMKTQNRTSLFIISLLLSISTSSAQNQLTVEDIFGSSKYSAKTLRGIKWTPDGEAFTHFERDESTEKLTIKRVDLKTGKQTILIDSEGVGVLKGQEQEKRFTLGNYFWNPKGKTILLPSGNDLFLFDVKTEKVRRLTEDKAKERDPQFSPDGAKIAYLKEHNLHVLDINSGQEVQLTAQGTEELLIGRFDWVYEEEFGIRTGFCWSPDTKHLAYFELDQSGEPEFPIVDFIPIHNEAPTMRYPKAGDPNAIVRIGVIPAQGGETVWMDIGEETNIYIPRIKWLNDGKRLAIQRLNRDQNRLDLLVADIATGNTNLILFEVDPNGWINQNDDLTFLKDGRYFIWSSKRSNWNHLYLYDLEGHLVRQLTQGNWDVDGLARVDEKKKTAYFIGTEKSTLERHLYKVGLDGKGFQRLTVEEGTHGINISPDGKHYLDVFSSITTPPRTTLYTSDGRRIRVVESGQIEALKEIELAVPEFFTMTTDDGLKLNATITKPLDFDPNKKYPALVYTYGCTGSQIVQNRWMGTRGLWHQMMLDRGVLILSVDNRGTGFKGNDFRNLTYRNMGLGVIDQINGAKYLQDLPYVDAQRIGVWGWSGGGWMTCMAMTRGADYFKVGVAVAPVTDWHNYDTIWTERRMDQPQDNKRGYDESNPMSYIDNYKGGLFLIHGDADDNVHLSNSIQMAYALQNARKPFRLMVYPRKLHGIRGQDTQVHLFNMITEYFLKEL